MIGILIRWLFLSFSVWVATVLIPGVRYTNPTDILWAAMVLGLLNTFVKPVLKLFATPFILLSFGIFLLIINAALLWLTSKLVAGFVVSGFWPAVGGSIVVSITSMLFGIESRSRRFRIYRMPQKHDDHIEQHQRRRGPPPGKGPIIDV